MRLRTSPTSPFVRKVLVTAIELGLEDRIERVATDAWAADTDLGDDNPLGKVPALATGDGVFAGSTLICQYLAAEAGSDFAPPLAGNWELWRRHALADGMMEATVARTIETVRRPKEFVYAPFVERQEGKILATLDRLETGGAVAPETVDIFTVTLGCALDYLDLRAPHLDWRKGRGNLAVFHAAFAGRPSMQATRPQT